VLTAISQDGEEVILANKTRDELKKLVHKKFFCPVCKEKVVIKIGVKVIPHFAHYRINRCILHQGETAYHVKGKLDLYHWLKSQGIQAKLEYYLLKIQQRPDILFKFQGIYYAIEFQCSTISEEILQERTKGYERLGIKPIWILSKNRIRKIRDNILYLTSFEKLFFQKHFTEASPALIAYDPENKHFHIFSDPYPLKNKVYAHQTVKSLKKITIYDLSKKRKVNQRWLLHNWLYEKRKFRTMRGDYISKDDRYYLNWLYEKGLHPQYLPSEIHLPIYGQMKYNLPAYLWQSYWILNWLHPLPLGSPISTQVIQQLDDTWSKNNLLNDVFREGKPIEEYLMLLVNLGVLIYKKQKFYKRNHFTFFTTLNDAIHSDRFIIKQLMDRIKL
jgi:competence protein CoiA